MPDSYLTRHELKMHLIEVLMKDKSTSYNGLETSVEQRTGRRIAEAESQILLELVHELITSNVLMTALNSGNTGWPWLSVTEHGKEVLSQSGPPVYDYEGYLTMLRANIPQLDEIVEKYLSESLMAYQTNLYFSSMVMLGCSSERAIMLLIDSYINSIANPKNKEKLKSRILTRDISIAYQRFRESFDTTKKQISLGNLGNDFDAHVDGVFSFTRLLRNSIVHPKALPNITSALVYSNLQQFHYYISTIFKLIQYYKTHTTSI